MTKTEVVEHDVLYNFFVVNFPFEIILLPDFFLNFLYFKIQILYSSIKIGCRNNQKKIGRSQ